MKIRVLTGLGIATAGIPLLIFSDYIVYTLALALLSALGAWELLRVLSLHKKLFVSIPAYLIAASLPLFAHPLFLSTEGHSSYILILAAVLFAYLLYLAAVAVFERENTTGREDVRILSFSDVSCAFLSVTYVTVSFTAMALTRYMTNGVYIFGLVFVVAWMCDTFAYFTGRLFGKHKLAPNLSPKKTIEGSIGGIVFATLGCMLYGFILSLVSELSPNYLVLALIGLLLSVFSQVGDLWASLIKREMGVKDYSSMLPGHGGVMDRFDSILAISALLMAVSMVFPPFL